MPTATTLVPARAGSPTLSPSIARPTPGVGFTRWSPARLLMKELPRARQLARRCVLSVQEKFWSDEALDEAKVQRLLRPWDPNVEVIGNLYSESHQVFRVEFQGRPCVVKFAGRSFHWKFVLRDEVRRMQKLAAAGMAVPPVVMSEVDRLRHPFFIMPFLGGSPRSSWSPEIRQASWAEEARIVHALPDVIQATGLPVRSEAVSVADLEAEIATLEADVRKLDLPEDPFVSILTRFRDIIRTKPWVLGQLQPPEMIHDGKSFWAIDWDVFSYTHPLKWVCDYSFYDYVKLSPAVGEQHVRFLLGALGFDPDDEGLNEELRLWQQYKAISVGTYLVQKAGKWEYFKTLQERFID